MVMKGRGPSLLTPSNPRITEGLGRKQSSRDPPVFTKAVISVPSGQGSAVPQGKQRLER